MRGVTQLCLCNFGNLEFQLTRLMRGVTCTRGNANKPNRFQLTRLMRGVTNCRRTSATCGQFQLTRLMRGVTNL